MREGGDTGKGLVANMALERNGGNVEKAVY